MKIIKLRISGLLLAAIFFCPMLAQNNMDISKYNSFIAPAKYFNDGVPNTGLLVFINYRDPEIPVLQCTDIYLLNKNGQNLKLTNDSTTLIGVYDIKISNNSKYLALYMVGEGHPWIEIYDLQKMINERKFDLIASINPYPGNVELIGWQQENLIIKSDINFLLKNENKDFTDTDIFEKNKKYQFNLNDKKFKELK